MPEGASGNPVTKWDSKTRFVTLPVKCGKVLKAK